MTAFTDIPLSLPKGNVISAVMNVSFEKPIIEYEVEPLTVKIDGANIGNRDAVKNNNVLSPKLIKSHTVLDYDYTNYGVHCYLKDTGEITVESPDIIRWGADGQKFILDRAAKRIYRIDESGDFGIVYRNFKPFDNLIQLGVVGDYIYVDLGTDGTYKFDTNMELVDVDVSVTVDYTATINKAFDDILYTDNYNFNLINYVVNTENVVFNFTPHVVPINLDKLDLSLYRYGTINFELDIVGAVNVMVEFTDVNGDTCSTSIFNGESNFSFNVPDAEIVWESIILIKIIVDTDESNFKVSNINLNENIRYTTTEDKLYIYTDDEMNLLHTYKIPNIIGLGADNNILIVAQNINGEIYISKFDDTYTRIDTWSVFEHNLDEEFSPYDLAVSPDNSIFVTNLFGEILHLTNELTVIDTFNTAGITPYNITIDSIGDLYVSARTDNRVVKYAPDGEFLYNIGYGDNYPPSGLLLSPRGLAICKSTETDDSGNYICKDDLFVVDSGNYKINKYSNAPVDYTHNYIDSFSFADPSWTPTVEKTVDFELSEYIAPINNSYDFNMEKIIETYESANLLMTDVAIDDVAPLVESIRLFVIDKIQGRIMTLHPYKDDSENNWYQSISYNYAEIVEPESVDFYNNNLSICNAGKIFTLNNLMEYYESIGRRGFSDTTIDRRFNEPLGITTDTNYIYVADTQNNCVQKIDKNSGELILKVDDSMNVPVDVAVDDVGNIYVAMSDKVVKYSADGTYYNDIIDSISPASVFISRNNPSIIYIGHDNGVARRGIKGVIAPVDYGAGKNIVTVSAWLSNTSSYQPSIWIDRYTRQVDFELSEYTAPIDNSYNFEFADIEYDSGNTSEYIVAIDSDGVIYTYGEYERTYDSGNEQAYSLTGASGVSIFPHTEDTKNKGAVIYVAQNNKIKKFALDLSADNSWIYLDLLVVNGTISDLEYDSDGFMYCTNTVSDTIDKFYGVESGVNEILTFNEAYYIGYLTSADISNNFAQFIGNSQTVRVVQPYANSKPCRVFVNIEYEKWG